jgi:hypothetical protein
MTSDLVGSVEAAARSMFITMYCTRAIVESQEPRESQGYYEAIAGEYWDSGAAGESNYTGFRGLAEKAVLAAKNDARTDSAPALEKYEPQITNSGRSDLDSRFGMLMQPTSHVNRNIRSAPNSYRVNWEKPPDPQVIVYL